MSYAFMYWIGCAIVGKSATLKIRKHYTFNEYLLSLLSLHTDSHYIDKAG